MGEHRPRGWMCRTDFLHEVGEAAGGSVIFADMDDLKAGKPCWEECGVVEVELREIEQPAPILFNLEGACAAAMDSLRLGIEIHANHQHWLWRQACIERHMRGLIQEEIKVQFVPMFEEFVKTVFRETPREML